MKWESAMQVTKLRVPTDENGLVPAGEYFKRLAGALREANERAGNVPMRARRAMRSVEAAGLESVAP